MAEDVVSLGVSMDSGPLVQGSLALKRVSESADDASKSAEKFGSATKQVNADIARLTSVNESLQKTVQSLSGDVSKLTSAMNDNVTATSKISSSYQAANDNVKKMTGGLTETSESVKKSTKSVIDMGVEVFKIAGYIKLATGVLYASSPALRSFVESASSKGLGAAAPAIAAITPAVSTVGAAATKAGIPVAAIGATLTTAASKGSAFFKVFEAVEWVLMGKSLATASVGMQALAGAAVVASPALRSVVSHEVKEGLSALPNVIGTAATATTTLASRLSGVLIPALMFVARMAIPILAVATAWETLKLAVTLANERIERAMVLIKQSNETGFGVEFLQRLEISAKKAGNEYDSLTASIKKFNEAVKPSIEFAITTDKDKIGPQSSEIDKRLKELTDLKNFQNNAFVEAFRNAQSVEDKYRAMVNLLKQAGDQGERLAALNLASTFASKEQMEILKGNLSHFSDMQRIADEVSKKKLLSPEDVASAEAIKKRIEEAERILSDKWLPTQNAITTLGVEMKRVWAIILETLAAALGYLNQIGAAIAYAASIPARAGGALSRMFTRGAGQGETSTQDARLPVGSFGPFQEGPRSNETMDQALNRIERSDAMAIARRKLTEGLLQQNERLRSAVETTTTQSGVVGDKSKLLKPDESKEASSKAWDKEVNSIQKHIAAIQADGLAVGKSESEHAALRTELQLLNAAMSDGLGVTQDMINLYIKERENLSANEALKKAGIDLGTARQEQFDALVKEIELRQRLLSLKKLDNEISFARRTSFLTSDDAAIAEKLKTVFGNDIPRALASSQAEAMRLNNALKEINTQAGEFASGFLKDLANGVDPMKAFTNAASKLRDTLIDMAGKKLASTALSSIGGALGFGGEGAGVTAGAATAASTLTAAGTSLAASMVAGATEAASILGLTIPPASATLTTAGTTAGAAVATGGAEGGAALAAGGQAAGISIMGMLGIAGAALVAAGAIAQSVLGQAKREREAAQALQKANSAAAALSSQIGGTGTGSIVQHMTDVNLQVMTALQNFHGAVTAQSVQLNQDLQTFFHRTVDDFKANWQSMLDQLGDNSAMNQASTNVANLARTIQDFVNNTRDLGTANQTLTAQRAGRDTLIAMLAAPKSLSDTAAELARIRGTAQGLQSALVSLGATAEEATKAIKEGTDKALSELTNKFLKDLNQQLNEATGKGFINEMSDLLDQIDQMRKDAAALGTDQQSLIDRIFGAKAQTIIDNADLVGASFQDLLRIFPQLTGVVHESTKALEDQRRAQDQAATSIVNYVNDLLGGSSSTLSPMNRLAAAQSTYSATYALAQGGNVDALNRITSDFENVRQAALAVYGSSVQFQQILQQGLTQLLALPAVQTSSDPVVQALLAQTTAFVNAIGQTTTAVGGTTTAVGTVNTTTGVVATNTGGIASALGTINVSTTQTATNTGSIGNINTQTGNIVANTGNTSSLLSASNAAGLGSVVANTGSTSTNTAGLGTNLASTASNTQQTATNTGSIGDISVNTGNTSSSLDAHLPAMDQNALFTAQYTSGYLPGLYSDSHGTAILANDAYPTITSYLPQVNTGVGNVTANTGNLATSTSATATNTSQTATNTGSIGNINVQTSYLPAIWSDQNYQVNNQTGHLAVINDSTQRSRAQDELYQGPSDDAAQRSRAQDEAYAVYGLHNFNRTGGNTDYLPSIRTDTLRTQQVVDYLIANQTNYLPAYLPSMYNDSHNTAANTGSIGNISVRMDQTSGNTASIIVNTGNTASNVGNSDSEGLRALVGNYVVSPSSFFTYGVTLGTAAQAAQSFPIPSVLANNMGTSLNKIVYNTAAIAMNTASTVAAINGAFPKLYGTFAEGGTIPPYGLGLVSEHLRPTFVRAGPDPIHVFPGAPANDNGAAQQIMMLRRENSDQNYKIAQMLSMLCDLTGKTCSEVVGAIDEQTEAIKSESRQERTNPKRKAA